MYTLARPVVILLGVILGVGILPRPLIQRNHIIAPKELSFAI
jgi:hypothetical protein